MPRSVAFGWNDVLNELDIKGLLDIERFLKVNIDPTDATQLFREPAVTRAVSLCMLHGACRPAQF